MPIETNEHLIDNWNLANTLYKLVHKGSRQMPKIFISYRRDDSAIAAGRIYDRLEHYYGQESLFMDIDDIPYGVDFNEFIKMEIAKCDLVLVIIGADWLSILQQKEKDPNDYVRLEIEAAIKGNIPIIPIFLGNTLAFSREAMPESISQLCNINGISVDPVRDFKMHMKRLKSNIDDRLMLSMKDDNITEDIAAVISARELEERFLAKKDKLHSYYGHLDENEGHICTEQEQMSVDTELLKDDLKELDANSAEKLAFADNYENDLDDLGSNSVQLDLAMDGVGDKSATQQASLDEPIDRESSDVDFELYLDTELNGDPNVKSVNTENQTSDSVIVDDEIDQDEFELSPDTELNGDPNVKSVDTENQTSEPVTESQEIDLDDWELSQAKPPPKKNKRNIGSTVIIILISFIILYYWRVLILERINTEVRDPAGVSELSVHSISSKFVDNEISGRIFVIEGKVQNNYSIERKLILLQGNLFIIGRVLAKTEFAYAGICITDQELSTLSVPDIKKRLNPNIAEIFATKINVNPGNTLPFVIVFSDLPYNLDEFSIEPISSKSSK